MPRLDVSLRGQRRVRVEVPTLGLMVAAGIGGHNPLVERSGAGQGPRMGWERGRQRVRTNACNARCARRSMRSGASESSADDSSRVACASAASTPEARTTGGLLIVAGSPSASITETAVSPTMRRRIHAAHKIGVAPTRDRRPSSGCVPADPLTASLLPRSLPRVNRSTRRRPGRGPRWRTFVTSRRTPRPIRSAAPPSSSNGFGSARSRFIRRPERIHA